jgi:DNA-directed RNA polymerase specialized sigma24 family protein
LSAGAAKPLRSREELETVIDAFTDAQWARLGRVGRRYAWRCKWDPDDLVQEAIARALAGGRNCPADVDVVRFLAEAMRGIADDEAAKAEIATRHVPIVAPGEEVLGARDVEDERANAEEHALKDENLAEIRAAVLALFEDDPVARDLADGVMEEMSKAELCEMLDLDDKNYASKRRFIRRRVDERWPQGWKR